MNLTTRATLLAALAPLWIAAAPQGGLRAIELLEPPLLSVDPATSTASAQFHLRNTAESEARGVVSVSDFISQTTGHALGTRRTLFQLESGAWKEAEALTLGPGSTATLKLEVSNLWEAGECVAQLRFQGETLGQITSQRYRIPFALALAVDEPVSLVQGKRRWLQVYNADPMSYPVTWYLEAEGQRRIEGMVDVPPGPEAAAAILVEPPDEWFTGGLDGWLRPLRRQATLTLRLRPPTGRDPGFLPARTLTFDLELSRWNPATESLVGSVLAFVLLILGAFSSLLVNNWVPNSLERAALKARLKRLSDETSAISHQIDSRLRVSLRVERHRIGRRLSRLLTYSPQLSGVFAECRTDIDMLTRRLGLVRQIDQLLLRLDKELRQEEAPFSLLDELKAELEDVARPLRNTSPRTAELVAAEETIDQSQSRIARINTANEVFSSKLLDRIESLKERIGGNLKGEPAFTELRQALPAPFRELDLCTYSAAKDVPPGEYARLDGVAHRIELILEFVRLYTGRQSDPEAKRQLDRKKDILRLYLSTENNDAIGEARQLLLEMKERLLAVELQEKIAGGEHPTIVLTSEPVIVDRAVTFQATLANTKDDRSAARRKLRCSWDFGHRDLKGEGWEVAHYFPENRTYQVRVKLRNIDGDPILDANQEAVTIHREIKVQSRGEPWFGERTRAQIIKMAIAVFIAILGLIAGARDQLMTLDPLAGLLGIFLLGFGADTIKNLVSRDREPDEGPRPDAAP